MIGIGPRKAFGGGFLVSESKRRRPKRPKPAALAKEELPYVVKEAIPGREFHFGHEHVVLLHSIQD